MPAKTMTLRLSHDLSEALDIVSKVDDLPRVEVIRIAIRNYLLKRKMPRQRIPDFVSMPDQHL